MIRQYLELVTSSRDRYEVQSFHRLIETGRILNGPEVGCSHLQVVQVNSTTTDADEERNDSMLARNENVKPEYLEVESVCLGFC